MSGNQGGTSNAESPKDDEFSSTGGGGAGDMDKDQKAQFCEIQ